MGAISNKKKVYVGMSGGVDSSVTAYLLKQEGYDVHGVFMRCYNLDGCVARDSGDAKKVAAQIGIPFDIWDFEEAYKERVVGYMVEGYKRGETPNPDVMCNREIKFGLFLDRALKEGADYVATGHYVRLRRTETSDTRQATSDGKNTVSPATCHLYAARDTNKDQSYFLWTLTQEDLAHCLFPIGDYLKPEVRAIAREAGLATAEKKDSQGICFLGSVSLEEFLGSYLPARRGDVLNVAGEKVGEHSGAHFYTIGQRHGVGNIKHQKGNTLHVPVYVTEKSVEHNTLTVAEGSEHPALFRNEVELRNVNFINTLPSLIRTPAHQSDGDGGNERMKVFARVRYRQLLAEAHFSIPSEPSSVMSYRLTFTSPQKFVASGQSAVFYVKENLSADSGQNSDEFRMLGGGVIS